MSTWRSASIISLQMLLLFCGAGPVFGDEREVLEKIRVSHGAALAAIDTFYCEVSISYDPKPQWGDERGKYWRFGEKLRCVGESQMLKDDVLVEGARHTSVNTTVNPKGKEVSAMITTGNLPIRCDPWSYGLLSFYGQKAFRVTLDELLAQPHQLRAAKLVNEGGRQYAYLDLSHDRARLEIWFDPHVNYLVRKMVMYVRGQQKREERSEHTVTQFCEAAPGIYFSESVRTEAYEGEQKKTSRNVTFSNIQINKPLPENIFTLRFPAGILVSDIIQGKMLKTDANGDPRLPATNSRGRLLHLSTVPPLEKPKDEESLRVTQKEPQSWTRWLVPVSLTFLGAGGVLWIIERWRKRMKPA